MRSSVLSVAGNLSLLLSCLLVSFNASGQGAGNPPRLASCTVQGQDLNFGTYRPGQTQQSPLDVASAVTLNCLCTGSGGSFSFSGTTHITGTNNADRNLAGTVVGSSLSYGLFSNSARTIAYPNAAAQGVVFNASGNCPQGNNNSQKQFTVNLQTPITVFARLPDNTANRQAPPGTYTGSYVLTVSF